MNKKTVRTKAIRAAGPEDVARALGLGKAEAHDWQIQRTLLSLLRKAVKTEAVTHAELARRAGSSRTRVTSILNGNLDNVSSDLLIRLLSSLGYRVKVSIARMDSAA
ncbi:MAG: helix-turn-helix domain-containing protein [Acidimicrobiia bacterium]|nr:helix-turn-helix domain-containing protein [Acidimicrobiia bacterium]